MERSIQSQSPSFDIILDYIFLELSADDERDFDSFLDGHPDYASLVDGLLKLCLTKQLGREDLEHLLEYSRERFSLNVNNAILARSLNLFNK